jgi:hypothetical protein
MYLDGRQLGNDLTDNAYHDDGYRFHDVMHLANASILGWSPVLRDLLGRKRKYDPKIDEVEDGARAKIVEEAVVKIIHSEGEAAARSDGPPQAKPRRLFPSRSDVPFSLIKLVHRLVLGLQVRGNKYWEWEKVIVEGYRVFYELCREGQGTVIADLSTRTLEFRPEVYVDVSGSVIGVGVSSETMTSAARGRRLNELSSLLSASEKSDNKSRRGSLRNMEVARVVATKRAILESVGFQNAPAATFRELNVQLLDGSRVATKAAGKVQEEIWKKKIIGFKVAITQSQNTVTCTALAICDPTIK